MLMPPPLRGSLSDARRRRMREAHVVVVVVDGVTIVAKAPRQTWRARDIASEVQLNDMMRADDYLYSGQEGKPRLYCIPVLDVSNSL